MATAAAAKDKIKDFTFNWEGKDKQGKVVKGELRAQGEAVVNATLRRQGILVTKVKKQRAGGGGSVTEKDVTLFTRQLATMMKAGVPLLQSFDIVGKGHSNPAVSQAADVDQDRCRDRLQPDPGVSQVSAAFRSLVLQPRGRGRAGGYSRIAARPPGDVQGKNPGNQVQNQIGAVLPRRHYCGRFHHHRGDHDFRDPGVQAGVHQLWRRPARANPVRDGDIGCFRQVSGTSSSR